MLEKRIVPAEHGDLIQDDIEAEEIREWTLMFYFASDNALAPSIVSQLKALKVAGFHAEANVVAHFDPYVKGTPSHVFEVNVVEKLRNPPGKSLTSFDAEEPFVRKLVLDKVWESGAEEEEPGTQVRRLIMETLKGRNSELRERQLPVLPKGVFEGERSPKESLALFLEFCRKKYRAKRYMLFILGHGVVVGNDVFLFDSNPGDDSDPDDDDVRTTRAVAAGNNGHGAPGTPAAQNGNGDKSRRRNSLTLRQLGRLLGQFKTKIKDSKFELLSLHSCSMSGAEVAYQLHKEDTANYMLASQGPAFVGSWPYRQILRCIFSGLGTEDAPRIPNDDDVRKTVVDIFNCVVHNSYDFHMAGYSFDVALCDLKQAWQLKDSVGSLASALTAGLAGEPDLAKGSAAVPLARELILLAHWDAQSFWQEKYTDLYDFCLRLRSRCDLVSAALARPSAELGAIAVACGEVIRVLEKGTALDDKDKLVVRSEFVGAEYQYTHGLSIYFPWAKPTDRFFDRTYSRYKLAEETGWAAFLGEYFVKTRRATRKKEEEEEEPLESALVNTLSPPGQMATDEIEKRALELMQGLGDRVFTAAGELAKNGNDDRAGDHDCDCPVFKNHPSFTGAERGQRIRRPIGESVNSTSAA